MHIPDEAQVLFVPRRLTYRHPPFFDRFKNSYLHARGPYWGSLGEAADQFIEEFFGADLEMERVSAILDAYIQQLLNHQRAALGESVLRFNHTERASKETLGFRWLM